MAKKYENLRQQARDGYEENDEELAELLADYDRMEAELTRHPSQDRLVTLLANQQRLMGILGIPTVDIRHEDYLDSPFFKGAIDGLVTEAAEVLDGISVISKPWKQIPREETREHILEEMVDVFFMFLELMIFAGIDADGIVEIYSNKLQYNLTRVLNKNPKDEEAAHWLQSILLRPMSPRHLSPPEVK